MSKVHDILVQFPSVAAGTDEELYVPVNLLSSKGRIKKIRLVPYTARTADACDYTTIAVKVGANTVASRATDVAGGNMVAGTAELLTLVDAYTEVEDGDVISVHKDDTGCTGLAFDGAIMITIEEQPIP